MKRKNWAIFDNAGFVYTGDTSSWTTGWSSVADDAVLFATYTRAETHMKAHIRFVGCYVKEV